ncbi:MAG: fatty acid desaturase [Maritimibacter sp.]
MSVREASREFNGKSLQLAVFSLFGNFLVYGAGLALAIRAGLHGQWAIYALAVIVVAVAGVRMYVLQHDFGHLSFFKSKRANELAGYATSLFTMAEFKTMQYNHNQHHRDIGNLEHRESGEIYTMTLAEWNEAGWAKRTYYRLYRNPFVLIPLGALWTYFLAYRVPRNTRKWPLHVIAHNLALFAYFDALYAIGGMLAVWTLLLAVLIAGSLGVFLVYLQHNFEDTYWDRKPDLSFERAAIEGASCLNFGWVFDEAVANITKHDIHHLNASIPSYRLREAHHALEGDFPLRLIGFREALHAFSLKLWDEEAQQLVRFPGAPQTRSSHAVGAE